MIAMLGINDTVIFQAFALFSTPWLKIVTIIEYNCPNFCGFFATQGTLFVFLSISERMNNKNRVPRLYKVAASVLTDFTQGKDSVKNLVYQAR